MQGNTMHDAGGNYPMVQGHIKADTGGNINLGIQVINSEYRKRKKRKRKKEDERENMVLPVVKDTAISYIVRGALDAVKFCLQIVVDFFRGAKNSLEKIEDSLGDINNFIVIAERSPKMDHKLMKLLEKLKDAAYDAQDFLEEYEIADRRPIEVSENSMPVRDTITNKVRKVATSVLYPVASPIIMRKKLKEVSERLEAIKAEAQEFQLEDKVNSLQIEFKKQRETHSFVHKSLVFERDEEKEEIVNWLLSNQADDHEHVSVISIVGIGGIGKTTLAKLAFDQESVRDHFKLKMWVCVSDNFGVTGLLKEIIKLAEEEEKKEKNIQHGTDDNKPLPSSMEELRRRLGETLSGKKFLLVLDDVWNEGPKKWDRLRDLLLCGGRGSRIVVTTRSPKVASIMSKIQQQHILKPLSKDGCWSLFCQEAFLEEAAHPNLAPIGREIVKKCRGIPLAVVTLGGLLRSERSQHKWEFLRDSEMWNLDDENENAILPALRLSYSHLKPHLKQCFAFCAIFPQDYEIEKELVIKLWMAHGFIRNDQGKELEDIGNEIFDELLMRSFFQDAKESELVMRSFFQDAKENVELLRLRVPSWVVNKPDRTTFRMHDLMNDLAHSVMENEYRVVLNGKSKDISPRIRHVSSNGLGILAASLPKAQMLRTYVMLRDADFQFPCDVGLFKCLRALDFMRQQDKQKVEQLFTSLGNLQHLRTNEIACSGVGELQGLNLRGHLEIKNITYAIDVPQETLINKQNLTSLGLMWKRSSDVEFGDLEEDREREVLEKQVLQGLQPHQNLKKLKISGPNFPSWMMDTTRTKLVRIELEGCWRCSHLPPLGELPFLKDLIIRRLKNVECIGNEFYGNKGFPSLEELNILDMQKLKIWSGLEWKGKRAFPSLFKLHILGCPMLTTVELFPYIKDLNVDQGMMQSLKNGKSFESMHQKNCNQSSFVDEDHIRSQSSLQVLDIQHCNQLIFSGLGLRYLSSLKSLTIRDSDEFARVAHELSFFTSLQRLLLSKCHGLTSLPEEIKNLTSLQSLRIDNCPEMASLPRELQRLSALKELHIDGCPALEIRCTKDTGEDWDKIQHIPHIEIRLHRIARD
ncbi:putative disease resistance protein RGA1 isoform X3 [Cinnamomum micranthum f. kanehirae]|uniref:Putative disease resistance protein RGA1 isoform X3 n=1 Tax=Cinnamomum micranthum f. kanehirae TaxID=337451 RepID=A0A3S3PYD5_9MAGN|nr:putative disease resistance protein RGA1 isoform X3 [Cinnamomum micranthum f. kanehirae]